MNLLASALYDPAAAVSKATSSLLAMTAFDTTNLRLAITVPAHGKVRFRLRCTLSGATTFPTILLGVMNGAAILGRVAPVQTLGNTAVATAFVTCDAEFTVTGLTPGALNADAAYGVETVIAATNIKYGGPNDTTANNAWGAFVFEAFDPQPLKVALDGGVNVTQYGGSAGTFSGGRPEVNTSHAAGTAWNSGAIGAATLAADTIAAAKIATGAITAAKFAAGAIDAAAIADGAIDAATLAAGTITSAKFAAGAIDATAIADGAIDAATLAAGTITAAKFGAGALDAAALAADAGTEIATAVWASASRLLTAGTNIVLAKGVGVTGFNDLSAAQVNTEVDTGISDAALATAANLATVDTVVDAIKLSTDNLPSDPADESLIIAATDAIVTLVTTVDTVVDAIKVQTDKLTFTVANKLDVNVLVVNGVVVTGTGSVGTPWGP